MDLLRLVLNLAHFVLGLRAFLAGMMVKFEKVVGFSYRKVMKADPAATTTSSSLTLCEIRHDSKSLTKLPLHLGVVILEDDISFADIANIVVWCMAMGISYISIYDRSGVCKRSRDAFYKVLEKQQKLILQRDSSKFTPNVRTGRTNNNRKSDGHCSSAQVDVILLAVEDGRQHLVDTTKCLSRAVANHQLQSKDILPAYVDSILKEQHHSCDPDLILKFGTVNSLLGFLPWQIRLSEILSLPTHHSLDYKSFSRALHSYCNTSQRFGK